MKSPTSVTCRHFSLAYVHTVWRLWKDCASQVLGYPKWVVECIEDLCIDLNATNTQRCRHWGSSKWICVCICVCLCMYFLDWNEQNRTKQMSMMKWSTNTKKNIQTKTKILIEGLSGTVELRCARWLPHGWSPPQSSSSLLTTSNNIANSQSTTTPIKTCSKMKGLLEDSAEHDCQRNEIALQNSQPRPILGISYASPIIRRLQLTKETIKPLQRCK